MPPATLYDDLKNVATNLINNSTAVISFVSYKSSPPTDIVTVELTNEDFNRGTVRITTGNCIFKLKENILIEPGTSPDFFPVESEEFPFPPYKLGWFAGVTCETSDPIVIDLNGFTIAQSKLFSLQQRFYAIIEIGDRPFLNGQGPSSFGEHFLPSNITIMNGILSTSSHHGIHSPGFASNVLLENLQIQDFEVAGIHLNGAKNVVIKNCNIGPIQLEVPVIGTYSQCRFIKPFVESIDPNLRLDFARGSVSGYRILQDLNRVLDSAFENVKNNQAVNHDNPLNDFIANRKTLIQASQEKEVYNSKLCYQATGGAYGIVLNKPGVAINGFLMEQPSNIEDNASILLDNVNICEIKSKTIEVVGLKDPDCVVCDGSYGGGGAFQRGPVGDIFRIEDLMDEEECYQSTPLSNAQLFVAVHGGSNKGTTNLHPLIIEWALSGDYNKGTVPLQTYLQQNTQIYKIFNGDAMAHVNKGNIGLFLQGGLDIEINNCDIAGISQNGGESIGTKLEYANGQNHPEAKINEYGGSTSRGIAVASCDQVTIQNTCVNTVHSYKANSIGIDYIGNNTNINTNNININNLSTGVQEDLKKATPLAVGCPVRLRNTTQATQVTNVGRCPAIIADSS